MTARLSRPLLALLLALAALAAVPATSLAAAPAAQPKPAATASLPWAAVAFAAVHRDQAGHVDAAVVGVVAVVAQPENRVKGQTDPRVLATLKSASLAALSQLGNACVYDETAVGSPVYVNGDPVNLVDPDGHRPCDASGCDQNPRSWSLSHAFAPQTFFDQRPTTIAATTAVHNEAEYIRTRIAHEATSWGQLGASACEAAGFARVAAGVIFTAATEGEGAVVGLRTATACARLAKISGTLAVLEDFASLRYAGDEVERKAAMTDLLLDATNAGLGFSVEKLGAAATRADVLASRASKLDSNVGFQMAGFFIDLPFTMADFFRRVGGG